MQRFTFLHEREITRNVRRDPLTQERVGEEGVVLNPGVWLVSDACESRRRED